MVNKSQPIDADAVAVFIDGCAVNRFALVNLDPIGALEGTRFRLRLTAALEAEYRDGLDHLFVPPYVKSMLRRLLAACEPVTPAVARTLPLSTDAQLASLATDALVVTDDAKLLRRWSDAGPGLIAWSRVEADVKAGGSLATVLEDHLARGRTS